MWTASELETFFIEFLNHHTHNAIEEAVKDYELNGKKNSNQDTLEIIHLQILVKAYLEKKFE